MDSTGQNRCAKCSEWMAGNTSAGSGAGERSPVRCVLTCGHPVGPPGRLVPWGPWGRTGQGSGGTGPATRGSGGVGICHGGGQGVCRAWPLDCFQSLAIRKSNISFPGRQEPQHRKTVSQPRSELTSRATASGCLDGQGRVGRAH